mmetsp:Transcript_22782/g.60648  ORF Transcript_22782/g.60648 Transcript_22782/m.60648 type:complete len:221 (-) Transcript_22782:41-703(-)
MLLPALARVHADEYPETVPCQASALSINEALTPSADTLESHALPTRTPTHCTELRCQRVSPCNSAQLHKARARRGVGVAEARAHSRVLSAIFAVLGACQARGPNRLLKHLQGGGACMFSGGAASHCGGHAQVLAHVVAQALSHVVSCERCGRTGDCFPRVAPRSLQASLVLGSAQACRRRCCEFMLSLHLLARVAVPVQSVVSGAARPTSKRRMLPKEGR